MIIGTLNPPDIPTSINWPMECAICKTGCLKPLCKACQPLYERGLRHMPTIEPINLRTDKIKEAGKGVKLKLDKMDYNTINLALKYFEREYLRPTEVQMHPLAYHDFMTDPNNKSYYIPATQKPEIMGLPVKLTTSIDQHELIIFAR